MNEADLKVLEGLVKVEHWNELRYWHTQLDELFREHREMKRLIVTMASDRAEALDAAYKAGANDMRECCARALTGSYDAGAAGTVRALPLPTPNR